MHELLRQKASAAHKVLILKLNQGFFSVVLGLVSYNCLQEDRINNSIHYCPVYITSKRPRYRSHLRSIQCLKLKRKCGNIKMIIITIIIYIIYVFLGTYIIDDLYGVETISTLVMSMNMSQTDEIETVKYIKTSLPTRKKMRKVTFSDVLKEYDGVFENASLGENGIAVWLPTNMSVEMKSLVATGWKKNGFNQYVSDRISFNRSLPDRRDTWCMEPNRYLSNLPATSVVICFHNEAWSTLLRTLHSVLNRSPEKLLKEIILVDDFSDSVHLKTQLDEYLVNYPKVKLVRNEKREGLIRAKLVGLRHVTATIVTYLDSHCECTDGWLEPLLDRIARDPTRVVCPVIDPIHGSTFHYNWYRSHKSAYIGGFHWNLDFRWLVLPKRERKRHNNVAEAYHSPTMAGGLFAINKAFFEKLGTYDDGFDIWGGENLELSFKTWMCGGTLEIVPCSHVGHVYRKRAPYEFVKGVDVVLRNSVRLAEVWLDDYSKYFYQEMNYDPKDHSGVGDLSKRKALRINLGCKSFGWYLKNVYPELFIPDEIIAKGEIRNLAILNKKYKSLYYCLDFLQANIMQPMKAYACHGQGQNQFWLYSRSREIRKEILCLDGKSGDYTVLNDCHGYRGNQLWRYDQHKKLIHYGDGEKCLAIDSQKHIILETCDESNMKHKWQFGNYNTSITFIN